jgi:hypothetical protein
LYFGEIRVADPHSFLWEAGSSITEKAKDPVITSVVL